MAFNLFSKTPQAAKKTAAPVAAARSDAAQVADSFAAANDDDLRLEVSESGVEPRIEQAAVLFAAGHLEAASAALEPAVVNGEAAREAWYMLFELYQRQGRQRMHAALARRYTATFAAAPPSWQAAKPLSPVLPAGAADCLSGEIVGAQPRHFAPLLELQPIGGEVVIDASRVRRIDFVSAGNLLNTVIALQQAGRRVRLRQSSHLVAALFASVGLGRLATLETTRI